jgi:branched-chain amino acid transport system permease protein
MMIGGIRTIWGPVWGSVLLVSLPQVLEIKPFVRMIVYGVTLIVIMVRLPGGLSELAGIVARFSVRRGAPGGPPPSSVAPSLAESDDA